MFKEKCMKCETRDGVAARREERGQSLVIVAFAIVFLLALAGLAVDLGIAFVERVRARRAADAAALAAVSELPLEAAAHLRALEYLAQNDYDCGLAPMGDWYACQGGDVRVEIVGEGIIGPSAEDADTIIRIDTARFRDQGRVNSANKIEVEVTRKVGLFFMRALPEALRIESVFVGGSAVAENINDLDVALVFDRSGSMEFDTRCYGCWVPGDDPYPSGNIYPLPWDEPGPSHCAGNGPLEYNGHKYIIIEAEEYSALSVPYQRAMVNPGQTFWVLGRNGDQAPSYLGDAGAYGRDYIGAYLAHHPGRDHAGSDGTGVSCDWDDLVNTSGGFSASNRPCLRDSWTINYGGPYEAPRADYDFTVPNSGTWYVWARAQGGSPKEHLFWGLSGPGIGSYDLIGRTKFIQGSQYTNGALSNKWRWRRMGCGEGGGQPCGQSLSAGENYTLHLWAGAAGGDVDRVIITTDPQNPADISSDSSMDMNVLRSSHIDNNRTGWACDPCDARFGGYPGGTPNCNSGPNPDRRRDDIYDDEQPVRGAIEASKTFVRRLDPRFDQIGYIYYSSNASIRSELQCIRRLGQDNCTEEVIENTVIAQLNSTVASGSTNIADGIRRGIDVLSSQPGHFGRPGAAHIMIVMTDGEANVSPGGACDDQDYWPNDSSSHKDCVIYYAREARRRGIVIYTITLGDGADVELMQEVAELTGGIHRHAPQPEQLDPIFEELYKRIFLRLVE
jgi:hypothetical protein